MTRTMSDMMSTMEVVAGEEHRDKHEMKFNIYYVPVAGMGRLEWQAPSMQNHTEFGGRFLVQGMAVPTTAFHDKPQEVAGRWRNYSLSVQNDEIFCVQVYYRPAGVSAENAKHACVMLKTRKTGPIQKVGIDTLRVPTASRPEAFVRGSFDIITLADAVRMGAQVKDYIAPRFVDPFNVCPQLKLELIRAELEARPKLNQMKVLNEDGKEVEVFRQRRRRVVSGLD